MDKVADVPHVDLSLVGSEPYRRDKQHYDSGASRCCLPVVFHPAEAASERRRTTTGRHPSSSTLTVDVSREHFRRVFPM